MRAARSLPVPPGGGFFGTNAVYSLAKWGIPFVKAPTGTMANNGAITLGTALDTTYSGGCWIFLPAGAVASGVPAAAAWLWCVMSSTTVGTVFNSTYTSGLPTVGTQTAFTTTGPGAFTGVITEVTGPIITVPGNSLSNSGEMNVYIRTSNNNSVGTKTTGFRWPTVGTATSLSSNSTTSAQGWFEIDVVGQGVAQKQSALSFAVLATGAGVNTQSFFTADLTASTTANFMLTAGTATDWIVLQSARINAIN